MNTGSAWAEDAKKQYPELFRAWREDPQNFNVDGVYPVVELWAQAKKAWEEILASPVSVQSSLLLNPEVF